MSSLSIHTFFTHSLRCIDGHTHTPRYIVFVCVKLCRMALRTKKKRVLPKSNDAATIASCTTSTSPLEAAAAAAPSSSSRSTALATSSSSSSSSDGFFSGVSFSSLSLHSSLLRAVSELGFEEMTRVQQGAIPKILQRKDVLGAAKTGSGKTLAFLLPALQIMVTKDIGPTQGTFCVVLSPTRELSMQTYDVCVDLARHLPQTVALVMGGSNRRTEAEKLIKGATIVVATPGRFLDHLQNTKGFSCTGVELLIIDEADRILAIGFEEEINHILSLLPPPPQRQTALFSATQTSKVADLARLSLTKPIFVAAGGDSLGTTSYPATVAGLEQGYVICPGEARFKLLFTFLKRNRDKKIMVFFSSCMSVKFHEELLNYVDLTVKAIHGKKKQNARMTTFYEFNAAEAGILLCTDVAARGLDIPKVDWIVQYDPPDDPREYIHRVGRTARGAGGVGKALLFLMPEEMGFRRYLRDFNVQLNEYVFSTNKVANVQTQFERLVDQNYHLHCASRDAYRSYLHAYASHTLKDIFDVSSLDLQKVAQGFGFSAPPKVELNLKAKSARKKKSIFAKNQPRKLRTGASGDAFSSSNPYGRRAPNDRRQFAH